MARVRKEKIIKPKKLKKCYYCKEEINLEDQVNFQIGVTKIINKYAHKICRQQNIVKENLRKDICKILDVPLIDNRLVLSLYNKINKEITYEVMINAIKTKKQPLIDNLDKPWSYRAKIVENQLPASYKKIQKLNQEAYEDNCNVVEVKNLEFNTTKIDTTDYSSILD